MEDFIFENFGKILILTIVAFVLMVPILSYAECSAKVDGMGFNYEWTFLGGCRIEYKKGVWIPLERYRVLEG